MGCFFALFAGLFPRLGLLIVWVARPKLVDAAFDSWFWRLHGFDWFWIVLAAILDVVHWGAGWTQRRQAPGYPGTVQA